MIQRWADTSPLGRWNRDRASSEVLPYLVNGRLSCSFELEIYTWSNAKTKCTYPCYKVSWKGTESNRSHPNYSNDLLGSTRCRNILSPHGMTDHQISTREIAIEMFCELLILLEAILECSPTSIQPGLCTGPFLMVTDYHLRLP